MATDKDMKDYLYRKLVPPGFRPQSDNEIEQTLDALDEGPMDPETTARILAKAKGEIALGYESPRPFSSTTEETAESRELLALHRSEGDDESDDVEKKLEKYRQQAEEPSDTDDDTENDVN